MAFLATSLTGFCALCSQVIWQKYLAILTGSEARSISLVVAVFLLGLASGYYVFGLLTEKKGQSRFLLIKLYGYVELLTGLYISLFPLYFPYLQKLSFNSPNLLIFDIMISLLALFLPTFLMGAGIPMLTAGLPNKSSEINKIHAKIYGWNTLGACLGALVSGFYLVPVFGLPVNMHFIGILNVLCALVFMKNPLSGSVQKQNDPPPHVPSHLPNAFWMLFVFVTGALIISFEVIFIRVLNLSIGSGVYNFPIILSIFIGALGLGSLSIKKEKASMSFFISQLFYSFLFLFCLYYTAPYWSIWLNNIRVSLTTIPSNYPVYFTLIFLFLTLFLFPAVFFMGRLLPLSYMFLKKTEKNYGKICGYLYFFNTLGTVFGSIVIAYLGFYVLNLDQIFNLNLYLLFLLILSIILFRKSKKEFIILAFLGLGLFIPEWDRSGHEVGFFRSRYFNRNTNFQGLFKIPSNNINRISHYFKDGPNTTVSLLKYNAQNINPSVLSGIKEIFSTKVANFFSYSIIVNGKSDGNSLKDFSTVFFMIPYLYSKEKANLSTAFVGLGTGLSAGVFTPLNDVKSIDVLEISPFVIKAIQSVNPELNLNVMNHEKVQIIETDAFKHWTKTNQSYDIVISEPSNPWVMGVENLFTVEFYNLVAEKLNDGGVFGQWLHTYSIDNSIIEIAIKSIQKVFPYASLYKVGHGDILIVASLSPLNKMSEKKFNQAFVKKTYSALGVKKLEDLYLTQIFDADEFRQIAEQSIQASNSLYHPQMIYKTNKHFFLDSQADIYSLSRIMKLSRENKKTKVFEKLKDENWSQRCFQHSGFDFLCVDMNKNLREYNLLKKDSTRHFQSYLNLRNKNLIPYDQKVIEDFLEYSKERNFKNFSYFLAVINEQAKTGDHSKAEKSALFLRDNGLISKKQYTQIKNSLLLMLKN